MGIIDASMSIIDATATPGHDALSKIGPFSQIGAFQRYNRDKCTVSILPQICDTYPKAPSNCVTEKLKKRDVGNSKDVYYCKTPTCLWLLTIG